MKPLFALTLSLCMMHKHYNFLVVSIHRRAVIKTFEMHFQNENTDIKMVRTEQSDKTQLMKVEIFKIEE